MLEQDEKSDKEIQDATDELKIMIALYENGYKQKDFDTILARVKTLGYTAEEAIQKIKRK